MRLLTRHGLRPRSSRRCSGQDLGWRPSGGLARGPAEPSFCLSAVVAEAAVLSLPRWLMQASCGLCATQTLTLRSRSAPRGEGWGCRIKPRVLLGCATQNALHVFKEAAAGQSQRAAGPLPGALDLAVLPVVGGSGGISTHGQGPAGHCPCRFRFRGPLSPGGREHRDLCPPLAQERTGPS